MAICKYNIIWCDINVDSCGFPTENWHGLWVFESWWYLVIITWRQELAVMEIAQRLAHDKPPLGDATTYDGETDVF